MSFVGLPLALLLFGKLPSQGAFLAKPVGLLLFSYAGWLLLFPGVFTNGRGYHLAVLALLVIAAGAVFILRPDLLRRAVSRWREIAVAEAVFALAFLLFTLYRSHNAEIWGTEKLVDFALLNGVLRSSEFPPLDPWFAGFGLNYYYFGYVIAAAGTWLAGAAPAIGFNLALGTYAALAFLGACSLGYDLARLLRPPSRWLTALGVGLLSAVLTLVAGNLYAVNYFFFADELRGQGFWGGFGWDATRVIQIPQGDGYLDYTINEFPAFSFILGDMHPHVMALSFTLLASSLAVAWLLAWSRPPDRGWSPWIVVGLSGWLLGALYAINSWDFPSFLVLTALGGLAGLVRFGERRNWRRYARLAAQLALAVAVAVVAYLPFHLTFEPFASGVGPVVVRSDLVPFLTIWGLWILIAGAFLAHRLRRGRPAGLWLFLAGLLVAGLLELTGARLAVLVLCAVLALGAVGAFWKAGRRRGDGALLLLLFAGFGLVGLPELVFVNDFFGPPYERTNTVFKLYYQAWPLLAAAAAVAAYWLACEIRGLPRLRRWLWTAALAPTAGLLVFLAMAYPIIAGRAKAEWYAEVTLDGLSYARSVYGDEVAAIEWLRDHAPPGAVVLEAVGGPYTLYGRVSAWSGVPTLIGWVQAEQLWRNSSAEVERRAADVDAIYSSLDPAESLELLRRYGVRYIFVGSLEREKYGRDTAERFSFLPVAFEAPGRAVVFEVPGA